MLEPGDQGGARPEALKALGETMQITHHPSIFSALMNACCGISILPNWRIGMRLKHNCHPRESGDLPKIFPKRECRYNPLRSPLSRG